MQYRIPILEGEAFAIRELSADARSAINALLLVGDLDWPLAPSPCAGSMQSPGRSLQGQRGLCPKMAAPFVFDYLACLIIAPQPERASPAPRLGSSWRGAFLSAAG